MRKTQSHIALHVLPCGNPGFISRLWRGPLFAVAGRCFLAVITLFRCCYGPLFVRCFQLLGRVTANFKIYQKL
jgi:hypothetical protein